MNKIRLQSELSKDEKRDLNDKWFKADTTLPFVDWAYIEQNVFYYDPQNYEILDQLKKYKGYGPSLPHKDGYVHFVEWLKMGGYNFYDTNSGRTRDEIIKLYDAAHIGVNQPENRITLRMKSELTQAQLNKLILEHSQYVNDTSDPLGFEDWLIVYHKTVSWGYGESSVTEYNNSMHSDLYNKQFMVYPEYAINVAKMSNPKGSIGFDKMTPLCYDAWGINKKRKNTTPSETVMVCDVKTHFTFDRMTLDKLDNRIALLEKQMEEEGLTPVIQQRIAMAVKYRNRLQEEG